MRTALLIFACVFGVAAEPVEDRIRVRIDGFAGQVSLYAKNLDTGVALGIRESTPVRTASTIKLPIMLAVFDAVARGQAKWTEVITLTDADKVSGSGVLGSEFSAGVQLPLRDVLHLMIVASDNTATNMILERFGADVVNGYLDRIGLPGTRSLRKVRETAANSRTPPAGQLQASCPKTRSMGLASRRRATWWPSSRSWKRVRLSAKKPRRR
ncbi:MAG: serine hydrolase [Bryobacteraceae bacterium]